MFHFFRDREIGNGRYLLGHFIPVLTRPQLSPRVNSRISDLPVFINWQIVLHALNCGHVWTRVVPFQKGRVVGSGEHLRGIRAERVPWFALSVSRCCWSPWSGDFRIMSSSSQGPEQGRRGSIRGTATRLSSGERREQVGVLRCPEFWHKKTPMSLTENLRGLEPFKWQNYCRRKKISSTGSFPTFYSLWEGTTERLFNSLCLWGVLYLAIVPVWSGCLVKLLKLLL